MKMRTASVLNVAFFFSDSGLNNADQNRRQVLKGTPAIESVKGGTYNLQIQIRDSTGNVMIGDNSNIDFQPSGKDMGSITSYLCGLSPKFLGLFTNVTLASIFRHKGEEVKKLGSASDCLKNAKQSGESLRGINLTIPKFALALLNYEQGRTKTHL